MTTDEYKIEDIVAAFDRKQTEARDIFVRKLWSRGTENITEQGLTGVLLRMKHDKLARLAKVANAQMQAAGDKNFDLNAFMNRSFIKEEDVLDDCLDASNYAIIMALLVTGEWS